MGGYGEKREECCGTCRFHEKDGAEWACTNEDSENYGLFTDYADGCDDHEKKN